MDEDAVEDVQGAQHSCDRSLPTVGQGAPSVFLSGEPPQTVFYIEAACREPLSSVLGASMQQLNKRDFTSKARGFLLHWNIQVCHIHAALESLVQ